MTGKIRLPDELGRQLRERREALGMNKSVLAEKAGKVREVIYRLEAGEDSTVSSLLAVTSALGLSLRLERAGNLHRFFEQVAFSVMVRNCDAHLKNFGLLYRSSTDVWLAPMFDLVTTSIYKYTQYPGGPEFEDHTLALKLLALLGLRM